MKGLITLRLVTISWHIRVRYINILFSVGINRVHDKGLFLIDDVTYSVNICKIYVGNIGG